MSETILITGGTGFLGSYLIHSLLASDYTVILLKRSTSNVWRIKDVIDSVKQYNIDIDDIEPAFRDQHIDVVIHTACCYGRNRERPSEIVDTNVLLGLKLFELADTFNADTFFNTDTLLQKYLNSYSLSKQHLVDWLKQLAGKVQVINMKLEHIYGPNDDKTKFVPWVIDQLKNNEKQINLTSGIQERDFIYVADVISAYITVLEQRNTLGKFSEFDVGTGIPITVRKFITELVDQYKKIHPWNTTELVFGSIPYRKGEMMKVAVNISSLENINWKPDVFFKEGISNVLEGLHS
jgi:nucleoside-diphosphate-sugar epimerase